MEGGGDGGALTVARRVEGLLLAPSKPPYPPLRGAFARTGAVWSRASTV